MCMSVFVNMGQYSVWPRGDILHITTTISLYIQLKFSPYVKLKFKDAKDSKSFTLVYLTQHACCLGLLLPGVLQFVHYFRCVKTLNVDQVKP